MLKTTQSCSLCKEKDLMNVNHNFVILVGPYFNPNVVSTLQLDAIVHTSCTVFEVGNEDVFF